jgi:creatinine amidohydrolase
MDTITAATSKDARARGASMAVLPIGSFEQHGDLLPLSTDTLIAAAIARRIADRYGLFLLPPITISCSHEHSGFAGTVSISARTLIATVDDIRTSLARSGIHRLVLVNGHGGNYVLSNVVQEANTGRPVATLFPTSADWSDARAAARLESTAHEDMHAGEIETSLLMHVAPHLVPEHHREADHVAHDRRHLLVTGVAACTDSGVVGRPSLATAEKGRAVLESLDSSFAAHLALLRP